MMKIFSGLILLALFVLLAERSGGSVQALRLDRILSIVDRFSSQMGGSSASKSEAITEDNTSETEKLAEEEDTSPELLEAEEGVDTEDIDRTHHKNEHHHQHKHKKPPIFATKTVFLQVTKHVTRHPVCLTVHGVKPPCLPAELAGGGHHGHYDGVHGYDWWGREEIWADDMQEEGLYIDPTATLRTVEATASMEPLELREEEDEGTEEYTTELVEPSTRAGRYLEMRNRETPVPPTIASPVINDQPESEERHLGNLMSHKHHKKDYKYVTKTLVVTKVQPVTDYRVTATLEAKNCIPHDVKIPFCPGPNTPYIPLSPLHPIVHGLPEQTIEHVEEAHPVKPVILKPIIKPPHKPVKPILPLPIKPPHKPIKPIFDKPGEHEHHEHYEHLKPPHHEKPEKPTKPIIPILSSILSPLKPSKPAVLQEETEHSLNGETSEQEEEVFDSVDENRKESETILEQ